jgi:hypothetical protein
VGVMFIKPPVMDTSVNMQSRHHPRLRQLTVGRNDDALFRVLLQFDLSQLPLTLPICHSTLYLYLLDDYWYIPQTIQLFPVLSRWNQQAVSGTDFPLTGTKPLDSIQKTKHSDCLAFNLTPLVTKWQSNLSPNLGLMVKAKDERAADNFISFCGSEYKDSSRWPYIEINYLDPHSSSDPCCRHLELQFNVRTSDKSNCTNPINTFCLNYSYFVTNNGKCPAVAYLQISPDGEKWITQTEIFTLQPKQLHVFVANFIAKFSRLCYTSAHPGQSTSLTVYVQGIL